MPSEPTVGVDFGNIQGLVRAPYRYRLARYLLFSFGVKKAAARFVRELLPRITTGSVDFESAAPDWLCNIAFTVGGLQQLGTSEELVRRLDPMFQEGPKPGPLGDVPGSRSDPVNWWEQQFRTEELHCIVQLHAREPKVLEAATTEVLACAAREEGVMELRPRRTADHNGSRRLDGAALIDGKPQAPGQPTSRGRVHFGYIDGFSRPDVSWEGEEDGKGKLHFRHFLLGHSTPAVFSAPKPGPAADLFRDSSYMVLRWLYQDVARFNQFLEQAALSFAPGLPPTAGQELVAAKLMGRWRNGTPLVLSPDEPLTDISNDFAFQTQDPAGHRCPFSAHIRVVNPRDQPLNEGMLAREGVPAVIRRGMPYGPELEPGQTQDDGVDRGILGVFLCTNIRRQFYTLTHWVAENSFSPVFKESLPPEDAMFGNRANPGTSHDFLIPRAEGDVRLSGLPDFVHTKGTAFFLLPSMSTLRALAQAAG